MVVGVGEEAEGAMMRSEDVADEQETQTLTLGFGGKERGEEMFGHG